MTIFGHLVKSRDNCSTLGKRKEEEHCKSCMKKEKGESTGKRGCFFRYPCKSWTQKKEIPDQNKRKIEESPVDKKEPKKILLDTGSKKLPQKKEQRTKYYNKMIFKMTQIS